MTETTENPAARRAAYVRPVVEDYGSLQRLTADFHVEFVGSVTKLVTMAVASAPWTGGGDPPPAGPSVVEPPPDMGGGPGGPPDAPTPGDGVPDSPTGGTLGEAESRRGGLDYGSVPPSGEDLAAGGPGGAAGGVREEVAGGAGLPFTGYASWAAAGIGAAMTTSGVILRDMLRRRR
jgi:hypothetical protein